MEAENSSAQRVRDHRAKQKALHCNTDVTEVKRIGNAEKEIEKKKNIYKENQFTKGANNQTYDMDALEQKLIKN